MRFLREKALRTTGALVILVAVAIAGYVQLKGDESAVLLPQVTADDALPTTGESTQAPSTVAAVEQPFVYRIGLLAGISTDNFWAFYGEQPSVWNSYVLGPTKAALYTLDPMRETLEPELALSQPSPARDSDGWKVDVEMSPEFRWSDGTPITAHDIVFTFETVRTLGLGGSWSEAFPDTISSMSADSDYLLRIEFTERPNLFVWPNGVGLAPIMSRAVWAGMVEDASAESLYEAPASGDVSGGPLTLVSVSTDLLTSEPNPGYPRAVAPDVVEYHVYPDESALASAVSEGDVDSVLTPKGFSQDQLESLAGSNSVSILSSPANGVRYLGFNLDREPMSDAAFRKAVALLFDRTAVSSGTPALSLVPQANVQWYDQDKASDNQSTYDGNLKQRLREAVDGMLDAGYTWEKEPRVRNGAIVAGEGLERAGMPLQPLTILTTGDAYDPARPVYVEEVSRTLALLGFDVRPVETDFDTVVDLAFTPGDDGVFHYDMYMLGWTLGNPALPDYYRPLFASDGAQNNTGYDSKAFEKALAAYEGAYTTDDARDALWMMEKRLSVDLPYLLLYTPEITEAYRSDRIAFDLPMGLGGLQARLGGIADVRRSD